MILRNFSATQINDFNRCQRYWHFRAVDRIVVSKTPAQQRGIDIHEDKEHYLRAGEIRESQYRRYIEWLAEIYPKPGSEQMLIEEKFVLDTPFGIPFILYMDLGLPDRDPPLITDLKTTSDFRYAKTKSELKGDTQMASYSRAFFELAPSLQEVGIGHVYLKVEKKVPKRPRKSRVLPVFTTIDRHEAQLVWERDMGVCGQMIEAATVAAGDGLALPPNTNSCSMFGGCPYQKKCGISILETSNLFKKKGTNQKMGFMNRIKESTGKTPAPSNGQTAPAAPAAAPPTSAAEAKAKAKGILPEDAPPQETSDEEAAAILEEAEKKAKKKTTRKRKSTKRGLTIYIDCAPAKGEHQDYTLFEDWIGPVLQSLNEAAQEHGNVPDYRMLGFGESKAAFGQAIAEKIEAGNLPGALVVSSDFTSKEALAHLIPLATDVVRALRG